MEKVLKKKIQHIDIKKFDSRILIDGFQYMSFQARNLAAACDIYSRMLKDSNCTIILCLAGSLISAGLKKIIIDLLRYNMVDAVVSTGAIMVDQDFFEALGFNHYRGQVLVDDQKLQDLHIDRIYDTYIDEDELQECDKTIKEIADSLPPGILSSREFIIQMGRYLQKNSVKKDSLVQVAYEKEVPIFCPAFSDSSAGFGLVIHQWENPQKHISIDSVKDFRELTKIKMASADTGLFMIGGGVPKNFAQDTVICAELLGEFSPMHKYAVQITVADQRDGACSGSTLMEASSWGKVDTQFEQMVFAEATTVLPLIGSYVYHRGDWKKREGMKWNRIFNEN